MKDWISYELTRFLSASQNQEEWEWIWRRMRTITYDIMIINILFRSFVAWVESKCSCSSRFPRNLPTFHETYSSQIRTQWSKWTKSVTGCISGLWADINLVARRWPPSALKGCSVTASGMKCALLLNAHIYLLKTELWNLERERNCVPRMLQHN